MIKIRLQKVWSANILPTYLNFNPLPNDKILDWSKLKAFADYKIRLAKMMIFFLERVKNIVGKEENAGYQHFLLFLQCFEKAFYTGS